jgi:hypothetical protein
MVTTSAGSVSAGASVAADGSVEAGASVAAGDSVAAGAHAANKLTRHRTHNACNSSCFFFMISSEIFIWVLICEICLRCDV